ncbi:phosphoribosylformylglycinamidine synthase subunit PurQ [Paracoccaceae bacterium]|nr:phosphoribosylformylglycinamidine synthase subunit PurQ [Paracoccaceae bacterium]
MKCGIIVFPGSNCDKDCRAAFELYNEFQVTMIWHKETSIPKMDLLVLPGGFSYGDYLRCGAIAAKSPIMNAVKKFSNDGGFIIGICNGFQILTEAKILPGALIPNINQKFICKDQDLIVTNNKTLFTREFKNNAIISIPIAHHDGKYFLSNKELQELEQNEGIIFKYKNNPNGSIKDIAGVSSKNNRVLGMMPHPERAVDEDLGSVSGLTIFRSMISGF